MAVPSPLSGITQKVISAGWNLWQWYKVKSKLRPRDWVGSRAELLGKVVRPAAGSGL